MLDLLSLLLETLCLDWIRSNYVVELDMNYRSEKVELLNCYNSSLFLDLYNLPVIEL